MMKLLSNPFSPYGRKVKIAMAMKGLKDKIEIVDVDTNPGDNPQINSANPLAKIPCPGRRRRQRHLRQPRDLRVPRQPGAVSGAVPQGGPERWKTLTLGSLADGILDAALLLVYEKRFRPEEKWHAPWPDRQHTKIDRALDHLEQARRPGAPAPTTAT